MPNDASPNPNAIIQGDTDPLVMTIEDANGPINVAGSTVRIRMKSKVTGAGHTPIYSLCTVLQGLDGSGRITNKGMVQYAWAAGETDVPAVYGIQVEVTLPNGKVRSFPNDRMVTFEIMRRAA